MTEEQMNKEALMFYWQIKNKKDQDKALFLLGMWLGNKLTNDEVNKLLTLTNKLLIEYKNTPNNAPQIDKKYISYTWVSIE